METQVRRAIRLEGVVQGVGFRPFLYRLAIELGLAGWVANGPGSVEVEAEGDPQRVEEFVQRVHQAHPAGAVISRIAVREVAIRNDSRFAILDSFAGGVRGPAIPSDLAACPECLAEIREPGSRRFRYPFTTCSGCGPRYSVVEGLPYDRGRTAMRLFDMCADCAREYEDPHDRRFHAETIACPKCGPRLNLLNAMGETLALGDLALRHAAESILRGEIVALKGLGGFQLLVDARNRGAVGRLRERKCRPEKPFALMFPTLESVRVHAAMSADEAQALEAVSAPIVLMRRADAAQSIHERIADNVAPENPWLGVMLPYTPLHALLLEAVNCPVVCTSGNLSEEPICTDTGEALARLGRIADLFLTHDRPIVRPLDDSVVRAGPRGVRMIRRARGYTPVALDIGSDGPTVLALGGHTKNTIALGLGRQVVLSQHIGDLDAPSARTGLRRVIDDLMRFLGCRAELLACDLHPDYASTIEAERLVERLGLPLLRVQHHHAHIAALMAEHRLEGPILGLAWDGAGYGIDGSIWGGEALVAHGSRFERIATIRPFRLPGGERAIREPRRSALGALHAAGLESHLSVCRWFDADQAARLRRMVESRTNAPATTSIGRLFDAVAALCGIRAMVTFEGQAAMELEYRLGAGAEREGAYSIAITKSAMLIGDWAPMAAAIIEDVRRAVPVSRISARFHNALAEFALAIAKHAGLSRVVLAGGCFQNSYLLDRVTALLEAAGFEIYSSLAAPPNDGGIALGQVFVARHATTEANDVPGRSR
ncbi:carbamoyltransferase HypF [bacterium]|nr:carbamoyltransferase HypF [bacterium]